MGSKKNWVEVLYGPWFKIGGFFYRIYTANRQRAKDIKAVSWIRGSLKMATVLTLVVWILIWIFASEESRQRLTDAVKESFNQAFPASDVAE